MTIRWGFFMSRSLFQNRAFFTLYAAQTVNLLGDALTWVGLALLSYELVGLGGGSALLATAFTLRVSAFVLVSPWAGVLADRISRKKILLTTHFCRMGLISLLPFVQQSWQLLSIVFVLNLVNGIFSPTYKATLPFVTGKADYPEAIALSSSTYQLLGVVGPGIAGFVAAFVGIRQLFFLDAITFLIAALFVLSIPDQLITASTHHSHGDSKPSIFHELSVGSLCLWRDQSLRYGLLLQGVSALAGAQILVNTVSYVQGVLQFGTVEYGWVMGAFGLGATIAAALFPRVSRPENRLRIMGLGCLGMTGVMGLAQGANLGVLMALWAIAGVGQSLMDLSMQTLMADRISVELQGRVYGAQFAWSHFWWMLAYPIAGSLAQSPQQPYFLMGCAIAVLLLIPIVLTIKIFPASHQGFWHEHSHVHRHDHCSEQPDEHTHGHSSVHSSVPVVNHHHFHFHPVAHSIESES
jgi:MFS transporter, NRE family, putaive nickel resistance protein